MLGRKEFDMGKRKLVVLIIFGLIMISILKVWSRDEQLGAENSLEDAFKKAVSTANEQGENEKEVIVRNQGKELSKRYGEKSVGWLKTKVSSDSDIIAQQIAIWALGFIGNRESVDFLISKGIDSKYGNGNIALIAIGVSKNKEAKRGYLKILQYEDKENRPFLDYIKTRVCGILRAVGDIGVLNALGQFENPSKDIGVSKSVQIVKDAIIYKTNELKDENEKKEYEQFEMIFWETVFMTPNFHSIDSIYSYAAEHIISKMDNKISYKFLSRKLDALTAEEDERAIACYLCGLLKKTEALDVLIQMATSADEIKTPARYALTAIGGQKAADTVEEILTTKEYTPRTIRYMISCGTEKNVVSLEEKVSKEADPERAKAFKDAADGIRKRIKEEKEKDTRSPKDK
jgi:hypothetical protein